MDNILSLDQFLEALQKERNITLSRASMLRYLKMERVEGATMGRDKTGVRRAWVIPKSAVQSFQLVKRGNPRLVESEG